MDSGVMCCRAVQTEAVGVGTPDTDGPFHTLDWNAMRVFVGASRGLVFSVSPVGAVIPLEP